MTARPKLTIGTTHVGRGEHAGDFDGFWFTLQSLALYHDLID